MARVEVAEVPMLKKGAFVCVLNGEIGSKSKDVRSAFWIGEIQQAEVGLVGKFFMKALKRINFH
eukprot:3340932-Pleurochrysis_carterae.AAC.1